ncbi:MAG: Vps62-related protein [Thermoanaerobaculia bacterium]|nr:Vps62-related protein [Thermoanaerobaculia bacterium]
MSSHETEAELSTPRVIRLAGQGEPTLLISTTANYVWVWSDKGSNASADCTVWRPTPTDPSFMIIGDYAQGNYGKPTGSSLTVRAIGEDPLVPLLARPVGWNLVWTDRGSSGTYDGSIWAPVAPDGYLALGHVANAGYQAPEIDNYRCLRRDLVEITQVGNIIWADHHSHANKDVTLYAIDHVQNAFVAQANYNPYQGTVHMIKGS